MSVAPSRPATPGDSQSQTASTTWSGRLVLSLASIVVLLEMLSISYMMISTALPIISGHYRTTQGAWLLTAFLLVGAMSAPLLGKLADMYGKRKMLLTCIAIAAVGSLLSAVATSYSIMIVGRGMSGLLVPCLFLSYSLIRDVFPAKTVSLSVSIATSGMGLVAIPAPFLTGWLIDSFGFRSIFWFFVIALPVLGMLIAVSTPESAVRLRSQLDIVGAGLLGFGIAGVLVGVSFGPAWGWTSTSTLTYLVGGVALITAWLVSARMVADPLIDLAVLRQRSVLLTATAGGFIYGVSGLFTILLPMMAMTPAMLGLGYGFGVDAEGFAIFQAPVGAMTVIGGLIVGALVGRNYRPRPLMAAGMVAAAVGATITAFTLSSQPLVIFGAGLVGLGMGLGYAAVPNLLIEAVPPQLQASTASLVAVCQSVFPAALPVIAFAALNNSFKAPIPLEMTQGVQFYTETGFQVGFLMVTATALCGLVAALALPKRIQQVQSPPEAGRVPTSER